MQPTDEKPPLLFGIYSDDPENRSFEASESSDGEYDNLLGGKLSSPLAAGRRRLSTLSRSWRRSRCLAYRLIYTSRSRIVVALTVLFTVQVTIFVLFRPSLFDATSSQHVAGFHVQKDRSGTRRPVPIKSHLEFLKKDASYLEAWVARGEVLPGLDFGQHSKIDGLWSWLNGSDPRHQAILASFEGDQDQASFFPGADVESRFRETDELRYSLRSAKAALGDHLRTSHLVSADYWPSGLPGDLPSGRLAGGRPVPPTVEIPGVGQSDVFHIETGLARHGQVPQWLDLRHPGVRTGDGARAVDRRSPAPALRVHHDWSIYSRLENAVPRNRPESPYSALTSTEQQLQWKLSVLPTFNSGAKEAAMGLEVTDLAEAFFYSNDDYWMGGNLTTADFSSPLYGPVFFTARYSMVDPVEYIEDGLGEMPSYKYTAWLLGQRFGSRKRSYIHHVHKTYVKPLVEEAQLMFGDELGRTASYRFRGEGQTVNHQLLTYNFVIERHREALLWSYLVARIDKNADGVYSSEELEAAFGDLGLSSKPRVATNVSLPVRDTLLESTIKHSFSESRFPEPGEAKYVFSSQDGYALAELKAARKFDNSWPDYSEPTGANAGKEDEPAATFQWDTCWHTGQKWTPVKLFKHMAFANTDCGDYLVTLLVALSGRKGLSAFLPHEDAVFPAQDVPDPVLRTETTPHLPLNERWQDGDFSLAAVARNTGWAGLSSRLFAMMLIQRYAYTMGMVPLKFDMITTLKSAKETFDRYKEKGRGTYPFLAINDDMTGDEVRETQVLFLGWMEDMWPAEQCGLPYERT